MSLAGSTEARRITMKKQGVWGALFLLALICCMLAFGQSSSAALSFQERVRYQKAIEQVYWQHNIWPADNPQPKPGLETILSAKQIENKTRDYLAKANALGVYFDKPITSQQLQAEIDRMARETKDAVMLRELWAALGNDPYLVAECLARPLLIDR